MLECSRCRINGVLSPVFGDGSEAGLMAHIAVEHVLWIPFQCLHCPMLFLPTEHLLKQHFLQFHPNNVPKAIYTFEEEKAIELREILAQSKRIQQLFSTDNHSTHTSFNGDETTLSEMTPLPLRGHTTFSLPRANNASTRIEHYSQNTSSTGIHFNNSPEQRTETQAADIIGQYISPPFGAKKQSRKRRLPMPQLSHTSADLPISQEAQQAIVVDEIEEVTALKLPKIESPSSFEAMTAKKHQHQRITLNSWSDILPLIGENPTPAIEWMKGNGLLKSSLNCASCARPMKWSSYRKGCDKYAWKCQNTKCARRKYTVSIRTGSWFYNSNITLPQWIHLMYLWSTEVKGVNASKLIGLSASTMKSAYGLCREICAGHLQRNAITNTIYFPDGLVMSALGNQEQVDEILDKSRSSSRSRSGLKERRTPVEKSNRCGLCEETTVPSEKAAHIWQNHMSQGRYSCNICLDDFPLFEAVQQHLEESHLERDTEIENWTDRKQEMQTEFDQIYDSAFSVNDNAGSESFRRAFTPRLCNLCQQNVGNNNYHIWRYHMPRPLYECLAPGCTFRYHQRTYVMVTNHVERKHPGVDPQEIIRSNNSEENIAEYERLYLLAFGIKADAKTLSQTTEV